jgi:hypothetical protein
MMMEEEKERKKRNLNPSHQLNLNTKNIHSTERRLNKIAIDALIRVREESGKGRKRSAVVFKFY